jgi:hypothetical protein
MATSSHKVIAALPARRCCTGAMTLSHYILRTQWRSHTIANRIAAAAAVTPLTRKVACVMNRCWRLLNRGSGAKWQDQPRLGAAAVKQSEIPRPLRHNPRKPPTKRMPRRRLAREHPQHLQRNERKHAVYVHRMESTVPLAIEHGYGQQHQYYDQCR